MGTNTELRNTILLFKSARKAYMFHNHEDIYEMLLTAIEGTDLKVEIYEDSSLPSYEYSAAIFSRSVMVISPSIPYFAHLIFCEPGTIIIEGHCLVPRTITHFRKMAKVLGMRHFGMTLRNNCNKACAKDFEGPVKFYIDHYYKKLKKKKKIVSLLD